MTAEALGLGGVAVLASAPVSASSWRGTSFTRSCGSRSHWCDRRPFVLLHAEFLAAAQLLLYAGGVVTIVVFAIMLTERLAGEPPPDEPRGPAGGPLPARSSSALADHPAGARPAGGAGPRAVPTAALGQALVTEWALAFEVLGVLLVSALLGALSSPAPRIEGAASASLLLAAAMFSIGLFGVLTRRNAVGILLGLELMLNAVNINLVAFARFGAGVGGWVLTLFTIAITVTEVAVGLAIVIVIFRVRRTVDADHLHLLRG